MASHSAVTVLERQEEINELDFGYIIGEVRHVRMYFLRGRGVRRLGVSFTF